MQLCEARRDPPSRRLLSCVFWCISELWEAFKGQGCPLWGWQSIRQFISSHWSLSLTWLWIPDIPNGRDLSLCLWLLHIQEWQLSSNQAFSGQNFQHNKRKKNQAQGESGLRSKESGCPKRQGSEPHRWGSPTKESLTLIFLEAFYLFFLPLQIPLFFPSRVVEEANVQVNCHSSSPIEWWVSCRAKG